MRDRRIRFAVLMDYTFSSYQEEIRVGTDRYFSEAAIDSVYFSMGNLDQSKVDSCIREILFNLVSPAEFDGIIIVGSSMVNVSGQQTLSAHLEALKEIPMVSIGPSILGESSITVDNRSGIRKIMAHLIGDHGYCRFAYVSGPAANAESVIRLETFRACLDEAGIVHSPEQEYEGTFMTPSGAEAVSVFLDERHLDPEVIVCANDNMAIGVWEALRAHGLSVPHDIAVTGYDDFQVSHPLSLQFTTIRQPFDEQGYEAARRLHLLLQGKTPDFPPMLLPSLRIRGSCGCLGFRSRNTDREQVQDVGGNPELERIIRLICESECSETAFSDACLQWSAEVRKLMAGKKSFHELECFLRNIGDTYGKAAGKPGMHDLFISDLHALLLEAGIQQESFDRMNYLAITDDIRIAIDRLQQALNKSLSPETCTAQFEEVADKCQTRSLFVVGFNDGKNPLEGASVIYAPSGSGFAEWKPGPGSWFPEGERSLTVNLIAYENTYIGYYLLDTRIPVNPFEYLRIRFCNIFWELAIMRNMRELNTEMKREIAAREESERRLKAALTLLEHVSIEDELTHLYNRRGFFTLAEQQIKYLRRQDDCYFVLFADLDDLKGINDRWGHQEGDAAIQAAAKILHMALRDSDIVARIGGDEFTALINKAQPPSFETIQERIRYVCDRENAILGRPWKVSLSIGHFCAEPGCTLSVKAMLERADAELYEQKHRKKGC